MRASKAQNWVGADMFYSNIKKLVGNTIHGSKFYGTMKAESFG
jgi:hypothetical protein